MSRIKRALYGWVRTDADEYRQCYQKFGGSINVHPDVIEFIQSRTSVNVEYYSKIKDGAVIGAFPLVDNKTVGVRVWDRYPVSYDEVLLPVNPLYRVNLPERSNRVSPLQRDVFRHVNYRFARKNKICIVREKFSSKSEKNRRNEYSRFLRADGKCVDHACFSDDELAGIYVSLFKARFGDTVKCYALPHMIDIIRNLRHMIFGHVLFIRDEPCAVDLILYGESEQSIYFDVPNGGVDVRFSSLSPGSVLMWKNIHSARELSAKNNKPMRFSIGALDERWHYKLRWADACPTGKPYF